jgi:hypothetical protein
MSVAYVIKRNGSLAPFDSNKIFQAIQAAIIATGGNDFSHIDDLCTMVIHDLGSLNS